MKLERDQVEIQIPLERWSKFSNDTKETVKIYAHRNPRIENGCICVVLSNYRVDELESLFDESV